MHPALPILVALLALTQGMIYSTFVSFVRSFEHISFDSQRNAPAASLCVPTRTCSTFLLVTTIPFLGPGIAVLSDQIKSDLRLDDILHQDTGLQQNHIHFQQCLHWSQQLNKAVFAVYNFNCLFLLYLIV
jgi:hypothetical protein